MADQSQQSNGLTLFTQKGERKYLNAVERSRYYTSLDIINCEIERSFCEMLFWTGCRPVEALMMTTASIDIDSGSVIIRSAKKRGALKNNHFRSMPLPHKYIERLDQIHSIQELQCNRDSNTHKILWSFARTKGWRLIKRVMNEAQLYGTKACARGLRHSLGIHAVTNHVPETRLQCWLGHSSLETTGIYVNAVGAEDRLLASRMWSGID